ncbi:Uncharacterized protein HZ326_10003 [Fusarium oxysporum f. sp. albedinis]|nr:Uncharacterized protein HZ326_10003 [Fusarium oxysporum f. sp. albedinis]
MREISPNVLLQLEYEKGSRAVKHFGDQYYVLQACLAFLRLPLDVSDTNVSTRVSASLSKRTFHTRMALCGIVHGSLAQISTLDASQRTIKAQIDFSFPDASHICTST